MISSQIGNILLMFAEVSGKNLNIVKSQKLVYLCHGFVLAWDEKPILNDNVRAWDYGVVWPALFAAYENNKMHYLNEPVDINSSWFQVIKDVWNVYGKFTGGQLSRMTNEAGTPWAETWAVDKYGIIPNDLIKEYYLKEIKKNASVSWV